MSSVVIWEGRRGVAAERLLHFVRYAPSQESLDGFPDPAAAITELRRRLPPGFTASYAAPLRPCSLQDVNWRSMMLLAWFALNNLAAHSVFVVLIRDAAGKLVHRSTVVKSDPRRPYRGPGYEVTQVWTDPDCRGRRLATVVLQSVLEAAPGVQAHWMVRELNSSSIAIVARLGFDCVEAYTITRRLGIRLAARRAY